MNTFNVKLLLRLVCGQILLLYRSVQKAFQQGRIVLIDIAVSVDIGKKCVRLIQFNFSIDASCHFHKIRVGDDTVKIQITKHYGR